MSRELDFSDGFTSSSEPSQGNVTATTIKCFADDASFVTFLGRAAICGDMYINTTSNELKHYDGSNWNQVVDLDNTQVLQNKTIDDSSITDSSMATSTITTTTLTSCTIDADNNTVSNIDNSEIKASAGIDLSKLETGGASQLVQTNGSGVLGFTTSIGVAQGAVGFVTYNQGDILYGNGSNTLSKLPAGSNGEVLTLAGGIPSWAVAGGGGSGDDRTPVVHFRAPEFPSTTRGGSGDDVGAASSGETNGIAHWDFGPDIDTEVVATITVPSSHTGGDQLLLKNCQFFTSATTGNVRFQTECFLLRSGTTDITSLGNPYEDTSSGVTVPGTANQLKEFGDLEITDGSGEIDSVQVAAGDKILVKLYRDTVDTLTSDVSLIKDSIYLDKA
jgi:hypothetical protein